MKSYFILLILFISISCSDYRKPSKSQRKCLVKKLGETEAKKLLASLRKYHRTNGKATLYDYILARRPDLKEISDECLLKIKKRRLDKTEDAISKAFDNPLVKYYLKSILRDEKVKNELLEELKKENNEAIKACLKTLPNQEICKLVCDLLAKQLEKGNEKKKSFFKKKGFF